MHCVSSLSAIISAAFNRDPNLWTVKCKIGCERETALIMMKKFASLQFSENVSCEATFLITYLVIGFIWANFSSVVICPL